MEAENTKLSGEKRKSGPTSFTKNEMRFNIHIGYISPHAIVSLLIFSCKNNKRRKYVILVILTHLGNLQYQITIPL